MRMAGIVTASLTGSVAFAALLIWVMWAHVLGPVDRVFWASLFGIGSLGGQ